MRSMLPGELVRALGELRDALVAQARLRALLLLAEERLAEQLARAREAVLRIEQAAQVQELLRRYFAGRGVLVAWSERDLAAVKKLVPKEGPADRGKVAAKVHAQELELAALAHHLLARCKLSPLCAAQAQLVEQICQTLPPALAAARPTRAAKTQGPAGAEQVLRGPPRVHLDPVFTPTFSLLENPDLLSCHGDHDRAPFYWLACIRESMAAELCALSMVEYDGLPLDFYRDFAKQAWDEIRHASYFLEVGKTLLPDFLARGDPKHPLMAGARRYARTGQGLPCPLERNLYEVAWNATLSQRLVLMHLDTETPGIARFKQELRLPFWRARPELAKGLRLTTYDEATHARLGRAWLVHLYPDRAERRAEIIRTRLLRGALMMAAFSHYHRRPLGELVHAAGAGR